MGFLYTKPQVIGLLESLDSIDKKGRFRGGVPPGKGPGRAIRACVRSRGGLGALPGGGDPPKTAFFVQKLPDSLSGGVLADLFVN